MQQLDLFNTESGNKVAIIRPKQKKSQGEQPEVVPGAQTQLEIKNDVNTPVIDEQILETNNVDVEILTPQDEVLVVKIGLTSEEVKTPAFDDENINEDEPGTIQIETLYNEETSLTEVGTLNDKDVSLEDDVDEASLFENEQSNDEVETIIEAESKNKNIEAPVEKRQPQLIKPLSKKQEEPSKRGRKSLKEINLDVALLDVPEDDVLYQKQYYSISEVAEWFNMKPSLLRFWENEFDIIKPRKNKKGDRLFRPEDVKNLRIIYYLLRQQKYSVEGAKQYLKENHKKAEMQVQLVESLTRFRSFLLEVRANLDAE